MTFRMEAAPSQVLNNLPSTDSHHLDSSCPSKRFDDALLILERAHSFRPYDLKDLRTPFENGAVRVKEVLMWAAGALLALSALMLVLFYNSDALRGSQSYMYAVLGLALISELSVVIWLMIDLVLGAWWAISLSKRLPLQEAGEARHDLDLARQLLEFDTESLGVASAWLEIKLGRMHSRIALVFGSADKVALLSLAGMGWTLWNTVKDIDVQSWLGVLLQLSLAFLGGVALGGVMLRRRVDRLTYQRDVLKLATLSGAPSSGAPAPGR